MIYDLERNFGDLDRDNIKAVYFGDLDGPDIEAVYKVKPSTFGTGLRSYSFLRIGFESSPDSGTQFLMAGFHVDQWTLIDKAASVYGSVGSYKSRGHTRHRI